MEWLSGLADIASDVIGIVALVTLLVKPFREKLFADKANREGQRCLLRSEIVRTYYRHLDERKMRQYEYENLVQCYKAYKALGGNSFIDHIHTEMEEWTVTQ